MAAAQTHGVEEGSGISWPNPDRPSQSKPWRLARGGKLDLSSTVYSDPVSTDRRPALPRKRPPRLGPLYWPDGGCLLAPALAFSTVSPLGRIGREEGRRLDSALVQEASKKQGSCDYSEAFFLKKIMIPVKLHQRKLEKSRTH